MEFKTQIWYNFTEMNKKGNVNMKFKKIMSTLLVTCSLVGGTSGLNVLATESLTDNTGTEV